MAEKRFNLQPFPCQLRAEKDIAPRRKILASIE